MAAGPAGFFDGSSMKSTHIHMRIHGPVCPQVLAHLSTLPLQDEPEVFGLHPNANITRCLQDTRLMLDSLLLITPQV